MPLQVLRTEYASVARPVAAFIDKLRERERKQVIVLIPDRLRYRMLHNHLDIILSSALRAGTT